MTDKLTPKVGDMVFDPTYGRMRLIGTTVSTADVWAKVPNPKTLACMAQDGVQECATAPMREVVKLDLIEAWLEAHEESNDNEAYGYLALNNFDGTCSCCGVDFTEDLR